MDEQWSDLEIYADLASAEVVAGLLRSESIPARVLRDEPVPGLVRGCTVLVPTPMLTQARTVCSQAALSEEEWSEHEREEAANREGPEVPSQ